MTSVSCNSDISDGCVLGFAGTVRYNCGVASAVSHLDSIQGLGQRADLVYLDEDGVSNAKLDALGQTSGIGYEQVVAMPSSREMIGYFSAKFFHILTSCCWVSFLPDFGWI